MRTFFAGLVLGALLATTASVAAQGLTYRVVDGGMAKALEEAATGITFHTMLWFETEDVLMLEYRGSKYLLRLGPGSDAGRAFRLR